VLFAGIAGGIAFPILPLVGVRSGLPLWFVGVILAANRAARVISAPIVGSITDRIGARRTLLAGMVVQVFVMALYLLGVTTGRPGLFFLLARLVHGPGSACVFIGAPTLALHAGGRAHGGTAASTVRAAMSAGMPIGLAVGGLLAGIAGEAVTFEVAMAAVAIGAVAAWFITPDLRAPPNAAAAPKASWRLLADRRLLAIGTLNFAMFFAAQGVVLTTIVLLVSARALRIAGLGDQGTAGALMTFLVFISSTMMVVTGRLGDRLHSHARIAAFGICISIPGLLVVGLAHSIPSLCAGVMLVGLGMGSLGPSVLALLSLVIAPEQRGRGTGALQLCGDVGGTLGPIAGTTLVALGELAPYVGAATVLLLVVPVALWLTRLEARIREKALA
jgi:MFS family permease